MQTDTSTRIIIPLGEPARGPAGHTVLHPAGVIRLSEGPHLSLIGGHRAAISPLEHALLLPVRDAEPHALPCPETGHTETLLSGAGYGQEGAEEGTLPLGLGVLHGPVQPGVAATAARDEAGRTAAPPPRVLGKGGGGWGGGGGARRGLKKTVVCPI